MAQKCKILRADTPELLEKQINDFAQQYMITGIQSQTATIVDGGELYAVILMYEDKRIPIVEG